VPASAVELGVMRSAGARRRHGAAQATLFKALDRARVTVVAPIVGTGVLWRVASRRPSSAAASWSAGGWFVVAVLVVAGSTLVGATR
jgi:hypothetical protein